MRLILLLATTLPLTSFSQITLTQSDFADGGDTATVSSTLDLGIDYTSTGTNYFWDFSDLVAQNQELVTFFDLSNASFLVDAVYGSFAPPAYQATYYVPSDALPLDQITQLLPVTISDVFRFSKSDSNAITSVGFSLNLDGTEIPFKSDTIETRYQFPLNYGDTYTSNGYTNLDMNPIYNGIWRQYITRDVEVDGWGTMTIPYGTFDVLRVRHDITETDSLFLEIGGNGTWIPLPIPDRHIYEWWTNNERVPLLRITTNDLAGTETVTSIEFRDFNTILGWDDLELTWRMYPNPTMDELIVDGPLNDAKYMIMDQSGRWVASGDLSSKNTIDVRHLHTGTYQIVLISEGARAQRSFVKQ